MTNRPPKDNDFELTVEDVGAFRFAYRTMRDEIKIQAEYARLVDGTQPTPWLNLVAGWMSALAVLTVRAPDGWDIEALDPLDDASYAKLMKVHSALVEKERSFRPSLAQKRQGEGQDAGADGGVLVPAQVQPAAD